MMRFDTIIIEFLENEQKPPEPAIGSNVIRLVEMKHNNEREFALYEGSRLIYTLSPAETSMLLDMLESIAVKAPWRPLLGCDGTTVTLVIRAPMSEMTFSWWLKPPAEWAGVGKIADFALALWEKHR